MLLGYQFVYEPGYAQALLLLLLMAPILLFLGYFLAKWLLGRKGRTKGGRNEIRVYVVPPNQTWEVYTQNAGVVLEISQAVLQAQAAVPGSEFEYRYDQIEKYLETPEARRVAKLVGTFEVYAADTVEQAAQPQRAG